MKYLVTPSFLLRVPLLCLGYSCRKFTCDCGESDEIRLYEEYMAAKFVQERDIFQYPFDRHHRIANCSRRYEDRFTWSHDQTRVHSWCKRVEH